MIEYVTISVVLNALDVCMCYLIVVAVVNTSNCHLNGASTIESYLFCTRSRC